MCVSLPSIVAAVTSLLCISSVTAISLDDSRGTIQARDLPDLSDLIRNASALLGWEVAGLAKDANQLNYFCNEFDLYAGRLGAIGLNTNYIKFPLCATTTTTLPSIDQIRNRMIGYNTDVFITQVLNAFDVSTTQTAQGSLTPLAYLCQYGLSYTGLDQFFLLPNRVMAAVCEAGNTPLRLSDTSTVERNAAATEAFLRAVSALFAAELTTPPETADDLASLCKSIPDYLGQMSALGLNADVVWQHVCYTSQPLTAAASLARVVQASTDAFIQEIQHVGQNVVGWNRWLCQHLSLDGLTRVGLNGDLVKKGVC